MERSSSKQAVQEKRIGEILMKAQDYIGARDKLLQALTLDPHLENINAMLLVPNTLIASESGDWYSVLQVSSHANQTHISYMYRMLTQSLEPLKATKFPGTDSALTALHSAYSVLSDQEQRALFDSHSDLGDVVPIPRTPVKFTREKEKHSGSLELDCGGRASASSRYYDFSGDRKSGVFAKYQIWAALDSQNMPRRYARINWIRKSQFFEMEITWLNPIPANNDEKKWCHEGLPVACGSFGFMGSKLVVTETTMFSHTVSRVPGLQIDKMKIFPKKGEVWAVYENWKPHDWCKKPEMMKFCGYSMVEILTGYSKCDADLLVARLENVVGFESVFQRCLERVDGSTFAIPGRHLLRFSHNIPAYRFTSAEIWGVSPGMLELDPLAVPDYCKAKSSEGKGSRVGTFGTKDAPYSPLADINPTVVSIKCKWSRADFSTDQIWAVYDGPDSMPRKYVIIANVISGTEVCTTFLDPQPMLDYEIHWVEENLSFVCGLFKAGRTTIMKMSQFSHVVSAEFCTKKSLYRIYPRKGEVWAVNKNWQLKWNIRDYKCNQCQIVEVISDFSEGSEMKIASLVEVNDSLTFFQRQLCNGFELVRTIPRREMLSFSHQIQCFVVPGIECHGFPEGSLLLEADALPPKHSSSTGWVAKDQNGMCIAAAASAPQPLASPLAAEALGVLRAIRHAWEHTWTNVTIRTDCQQLMKAIIHEEDSANNGISPFIFDINKIRNSLLSFVSFIPRTSNISAHK